MVDAFNNDVLQEVYASSNNLIINYQLTTGLDACSKTLKSTNADSFHFYLTNEENEEIIIQGSDVLITLLLYKSDDFTDMFKKFVKWSV
jgi:uncharacterized protein YjgD (DUF1641 family)